MQQLLILGAGGHAQVVADILQRAYEAGAQLRPLGFLDDNAELQGQRLLGLPVLGSLAALEHIQHDAVIVAIGDNHTRRALFARLEQRNERFATARHPSAVIAPDVHIGRGTMICAAVVVNPGSVVGANVILNTGCTVDHHNRIADHVHIAPGSHLGGEVEVETGALVGIGATVMPRRRVGAWSVAGAGALIDTDLAAHVVAVGVPARVIKHISEE